MISQAHKVSHFLDNWLLLTQQCEWYTFSTVSDSHVLIRHRCHSAPPKVTPFWRLVGYIDLWGMAQAVKFFLTFISNMIRVEDFGVAESYTHAGIKK
jgi:hypothetical protein